MAGEEFVAELNKLYEAAGRPSYRSVSTQIRRDKTMPDTVSHETVGALLRGETLSSWQKVESVVRQLAARAVHRPDVDKEAQRFHPLWIAAMDAR